MLMRRCDYEKKEIGDVTEDNTIPRVMEPKAFSESKLTDKSCE